MVACAHGITCTHVHILIHETAAKSTGRRFLEKTKLHSAIVSSLPAHVISATSSFKLSTSSRPISRSAWAEIGNPAEHRKSAV
jgi:hypothetical protein